MATISIKDKDMNRLTEKFFRAPTGVFTLADVAVSVDGSDFSRHGLIKRAMSAGEILKIRRGLYCLAPEFQKKPISVYGLAQRIYGPSYISMETALSYHGWIPEKVYACTCASFGNSKDFETPLGVFSYKRVPQHTFFHGVERCGDENGNVIFMASPAKALVDYLYIHQLNWSRIDEPTGSLRIDEDELACITTEELEALLNNYSNGRIKRFLFGWLGGVKT
jgi:predicted transcriptional regulator of viral defense system